jgi:beta-glucosidase
MRNLQDPRIVSAWYQMGQDAPTQPAPGVGIQSLSAPHQVVDARSPDSVPVRLDGAVGGHVLVKNTNNALPLNKPVMLSIFGYDATAPPTKDIDNNFVGGSESVDTAGPIGPVGVQVNPPIAMGGTIICGGGSGANSPSYIYAVCIPCRSMTIRFFFETNISL